MKVGAVTESVTVSGASPLIDLTATKTSTTFIREALEALPTTRNSLLSLAVQTPGVRVSAGNFDVGGSKFTAVTANMNNFGRQGDNIEALDGVWTGGGSGSGIYFDFASYEEAQVTVGGASAEMPGSGVLTNVIVRSGSNNFHGSVYYGGTGPWAQTTNLDDALRARGVTTGNALVRRYDVSGDLGGRILRDKLWFYAGGRRAIDDSNVLGAVKDDGSPGDAYNLQKFWTVKLSSQVNRANRIVGLHQPNFKGIDLFSRFNSWESRARQNQPGQVDKVEWLGVFGNSVSASALYGFWSYNPALGGYAPGQVGTFDLVTLRYTGDQISSWIAPQEGHQRRHTVQANLSWFKPSFFHGDHEFKGGLVYSPSVYDWVFLPRGASGDYSLRFRSGVPFQVAVYNIPVHSYERADYTGMFVQDNWTLGSVTVSGGIRWDHNNAFVPPISRPAGTFAAAQDYPRVQLNVWNSAAPRLHAAWKLTPDGRTVVKGGWGRFNKIRYARDEVEPVNPSVLTVSTYRWNDLNGNKQFDPGEVNLDPNGPDFVSRTGGSFTGTTGIGRLMNPDEEQPNVDEFTLTFERELAPLLAVRVTGAYSRQSHLRNLLRPLRSPEAYSIPVRNTDPGPDGRVGTADDPGSIVTYYEYPRALQGATFELAMPVNSDIVNAYRGFEVAVTKRYSNNWQLLGAVGRLWKDLPRGLSEFIPLDPNSLAFAEDKTSSWYAKLGGSYQFPWQIRTSASLNAVSGEPYRRTVLLTGGTTLPSITLPVEPWGSRHLPNAFMLDARLEKMLRFKGGHKLAVHADVFNLLNTNVATAATAQSGASFGTPTAIIPARIAVFSVSHTF